MDIIKEYELFRACYEALEWLRANDHLTPQELWDSCKRGDWMLWSAARFCADYKLVVLATCDCARIALPYARGDAALLCIETVEAWTRGESTIEAVNKARTAYAAAAAAPAAAAAADAAAAYAADAAYAAKAADAAAAAVAAVYAAAAAAAAVAAAVAYAAYAAAANTTHYAAAYAETLKRCAELVRAHIPIAPHAGK